MENKKVLYTVTGLPDWVSVAKMLQENHKWIPVYWITVPGLEKEVKKAYPDIIHHWFFDINRGIYHKEFSNIPLSLDKTVIRQFMNQESIALQMLQRYDPYKSFTHEERKRLYYNQLRYWFYVLKEMDIDIVVFTESPHSITQYVLYAVCKHYGIQTVMIGSTSIPGLVFPKIDFEDTPTYSIDFEEDSELPDMVYNDIKSYLDRLNGDYNQAEPWYMKQQKKKSQFNSKFGTLLNKVLTVLSTNNDRGRNNYLKLPGEPIETTKLTFFDFLKIKIYSKKAIKNLHSKYQELAQVPDLENTNYIYFPLHFQPERTSCPEGDIYADQLLVIQMISSALPEGWVLYVKEHPSQFMLANGYMGRDQWFYKDVAHITNVKLIDQSRDTFEIIDRARAVVTLTGTVGLEAIIRNVPALVFGYAWYRECPGVFYTNTNEECRSAINEIQKGYKADRELATTYLLGLFKNFTKGYLNPSNKASINISKEQHVKNLYDAILSVR